MKMFWLLAVCGLVVVAPLATVGFAQGTEEEEEITLSLKEIGRLNIFEDRALSEADAAFNRGEYAEAGNKYDAFVKKFADSPTGAYALLRKGRCAELDGKRPEAIEAYAAVAKKFPKATKYVVPALCHLGDCHTKGGASEDAVKAWKQIGDNADYIKHPDAPGAIRKLAAALKKLDKAEEALKYQQKVPASSIPSSPSSSTSSPSSGGATASEPVDDTTKSIIRQHVRVAPDEAKLLEFYKKITKDAPDDPAKTPEYWSWVMEGVTANGDFGWSERELRKTYYEKWIKVMEGKFPESDNFQIGLAGLHYGADRDRDKYAERLDAQFKKFQKKGDTKRILRWVRAYKGNWTKTKEYAAMLNYETSGLEGITELIDILVNEQQESYLAKSTFKKVCENIPYDKLSNDDIMKLITLARETLEDSSTAKTLADKLHLDKMSEKEKLELARKFLKLDAGMAEPIYAKLEDKDAGKMELFEYYLDSGESSKAISLAEELAKIEKYAKAMSEKKAQLLEAAKRYSEAITAYQELGNPPANLWRIVECHLGMNEPDKAVEQLRQIAANHKAEASKAVYRIATLYGDAVDQDPTNPANPANKAKQVAVLREIVNKYPGTPEAKKAQTSIDDLGIPPANPEGITLGF